MGPIDQNDHDPLHSLHPLRPFFTTEVAGVGTSWVLIGPWRG